jgi:hypothetical protein
MRKLVRRIRPLYTRSAQAPSRDRRGLVSVGRTATMIRGDYGQKEDTMRRYQD